eukprot:scaffold126651_cov72-Phaeocystis_antarctica.AAC.1
MRISTPSPKTEGPMSDRSAPVPPKPGRSSNTPSAIAASGEVDKSGSIAAAEAPCSIARRVTTRPVSLEGSSSAVQNAAKVYISES